MLTEMINITYMCLYSFSICIVFEEKCTFKLEISRVDSANGNDWGNVSKTVEGKCGDVFKVDGVAVGYFNDAYTNKNCPDWDGGAAPDCCVSNYYGKGVNKIMSQNGEFIGFAHCSFEKNVIISQEEVNCMCSYKTGLFFHNASCPTQI